MKWAARQGLIIRNQAHGSPGNIIDLHATSDIPETEGADIVPFKTASSAAHLMGRRLASAEALTWLDEHWLSSLGDARRAVDGPEWLTWREIAMPQVIDGEWTVAFLRGGPSLPAPVKVRELKSWTEFGGEALTAFSGTAHYSVVFDRPVQAD